MATVAVSSLVVSCGTPNHTDRTGSLAWRPCGQIECTTLSVPLDWSHPNTGLVTLRLARRPASGQRTAVLLTNPGGPGGSGVELVQQSADAFDSSVLAQFDIVSWDPRGVAASTAAACGAHLDYFYEVDRTDTDAATAAAINRSSSLDFIFITLRTLESLGAPPKDIDIAEMLIV